MILCTNQRDEIIYFFRFQDNKPLELANVANDLGEYDNEPQYQLIDNDQILHISEVDVRHAGRYSCFAENRAGRAEKDISVSLLSEFI